MQTNLPPEESALTKEIEPRADNALNVKIEECRKAHGSFVADTIPATVNAMDGQVSPDDLEAIDEEAPECQKRVTSPPCLT